MLPCMQVVGGRGIGSSASCACVRTRIGGMESRIWNRNGWGKGLWGRDWKWEDNLNKGVGDLNGRRLNGVGGGC